ncbi:carboxyl-terminal processing protease [Ereboglobus sp. PH5-5]|uniref:S41 family peptidase n=1 Tax=Ereboglobus sp. PH5-5 TaxID=2940529 RepID=UPI002404FA43|nr:S41 family peptidase [Ereboglobus sp. PH5-5]MDF9833924.1 carboxyl-terminal processing protease [Ereboglobus sp. PH5-5]
MKTRAAKGRCAWLFLAVAFALLFSGCASTPDRAWFMPRVTPRASDKTPRADYNRIVFDHACKLTGIYFYDETFGGRDWPALQAKHRAKAGAAKNNEELYNALNEMLKELGSSHATAIAPEIVRAQKKMRADAVSLIGYISVRLPGLDTPVVYEVTPDSPASEAGVKRGWLQVGVLLRDNTDVPAHEGEVARQQFLDENNTLRTVTFTLRAVRGLGSRNFAEMRPDGVLYLRFDRFSGDSAAWVREQLKTHAGSARGVVLDLRLNGGGEVGACRRVLGEFFTKPVKAGVFLDRRGRASAVEASVSRRGAHYTGPLAVLVARMSGSGAEVFSAAIQDNKRGVIVGSTSTGRTAGAVLMSVDFSLPGGGRLQLPLSNYKTAAGVLLEGRGVPADINAPLPTVESLRAGEDPALECAARTVLGK